jgi:preprotein translocase subunit SecY
LLITIGLLIAFRFIAHVPLPGVDRVALENLFESNAMLGMFDLFTGGAMRNFSVAAMGVMPYITASIVMQLMTPVIPRLQAMLQEGESGRKRMNVMTYWLTIPLAALSGYGQLTYLQRSGVVGTDGLTTAAIIISMAAGTLFLVWLGEQITEYGLGNGISIIIMGGIIATLPMNIAQGFLEVGSRNIGGLVTFVIIALLTTALIVLFTEAHRRIPVQYARSTVRGDRMYRQSGSSYIPIRVNSAGMIPLIFASSLIMLPYIISSYFANPVGTDPNLANQIMTWFDPNASLPLGLVYWGLTFGLVVAFAFFYTMIMFQQQDLPGALQKQGGFVPGVRPGNATREYLEGVLLRITWAGAFFLALVAVIPFFAREITGVQAVQLSSFGMLIVVGVVLDTMKQLEAQLTVRRYEGFIR